MNTVFCLMAQHPGKLFTKEQIFESLHRAADHQHDWSNQPENPKLCYIKTVSTLISICPIIGISAIDRNL